MQAVDAFSVNVDLGTVAMRSSSSRWRATRFGDRHTLSNQKLLRWNGYPGTEMRRRASPANRPAKSSASPASYAFAADRTWPNSPSGQTSTMVASPRSADVAGPSVDSGERNTLALQVDLSGVAPGRIIWPDMASSNGTWTAASETPSRNDSTSPGAQFSPSFPVSSPRLVASSAPVSRSNAPAACAAAISPTPLAQIRPRRDAQAGPESSNRTLKRVSGGLHQQGIVRILDFP